MRTGFQRLLQEETTAMRLSMLVVSTMILVSFGLPSDVPARGFGGFRGGVAVGPHGAVAGSARGGVAVGPFGGVSAGGARTGAHVGPRGTTGQAGQVGGVARGRSVESTPAAPRLP